MNLHSSIETSAVENGALRTEAGVDDLAIITVSTNESQWLRPCLSTVFAHTGGASVDVVVVDNESSDGTADLVAAEFPDARVVWSRNLGFGHANNRGVMTCNARYILFLNPDTEIRRGLLRRAGAADGRPADGRPRRRAAGHARRPPRHDHPPLPQRAARAG